MKQGIRLTAGILVMACAHASTAPSGPAPAPKAPPPMVTPPVVVPPVAPAPPPMTPIPPAGSIDPTGTYQLQVVFAGQAAPFTMELYKESGAWRGTVANPNIGSASVAAVTVDGNKFRVSLNAQNGGAYSLSFELNPDNTVKGNWEGGGDGSPITGRKIR